MSREIKFRAWDKTYSLMNYKVQVGNTDYADQNYTCNSIWVDYGDKISIGWINADDKCIDLMQYTGLKDKNGVEIYEGDIIKTNYYSGTPGDFKRLIGFVKYHRTSFMVYGIKKYEGLRKELHGDSKIVGNIYQNPELL